MRLPKAVVKQLGLAPGMILDVSVEGAGVKLAPAFGTEDGRLTVPAGRPEPFPVTRAWLLEEAERLGGLANAPRDDVDWGPDIGSEVIYDDYNTRKKAS